jgi:pimeloyl-ACP methyl ester carboxylesterase
MPPALLGRYAAPFVGREGVRHFMQIQRAINDRAMAGVVWENIEMPVRVVRGDSDSWVEPQVAATLASRLPRAEHLRVAGAARLVPEDTPAAFVELLREWIGPEAQAT